MGRRCLPGMMPGRAGWRGRSYCACCANCGRSNVDPKYGVEASRRVVEPGEPVPKGGGRYSVGKPYQVAGRTYVPEENANYEAEGMASWYGDDFHGRLTANGEVFDMNSISAAHPTLPIPSYARVTNLRNNKSLIVRVNDRGPFHENRVIDVSVRAAKLLDFHRFGVTRVKVEYVGRAALEGSDDAKLAATLSTGSPASFPDHQGGVRQTEPAVPAGIFRSQANRAHRNASATLRRAGPHRGANYSGRRPSNSRACACRSELFGCVRARTAGASAAAPRRRVRWTGLVRIPLRTCASVAASCRAGLGVCAAL